MKFTVIASSVAAFSTLAQASINLSYEKPYSGPIVPHSEVRVSWETTETYDLMLSLVKHEPNTRHWPLNYRPMRTVWLKLRMDAGNASFAFWDIPEVDEKGWYAFAMEGRKPVDDELVVLDTGLTEWFPIHKAGKHLKGDKEKITLQELKV